MVGGNRMKKRIKRSLGDRIFDIVNTIFMIGMMIIMLYPFGTLPWHPLVIPVI